MTTASADVVASGLVRSRLEATRPRYGEKVILGLLFACAMVSVITTFGIVVALIPPTIEFFQEVSPFEFFTGTEWSPLFAQSRVRRASAACRHASS